MIKHKFIHCFPEATMSNAVTSKRANQLFLRWLVILGTLLTAPVHGFDVAIKTGSVHIAQQNDLQASSPPDMSTPMINADGDAGYYLRANRDALFKVNFVATGAGVELSRFRAWLTVYNHTNAANGQSFELARPSGANAITELPVNWDQANATHRYEDSYTTLIPGSVIQSGLRWTLNWVVFDNEPGANGAMSPNGKFPVIATHLLKSQAIAVSLFDAYTPELADWRTYATAPFHGTQHTSHSPDGVHGVDWASESWDGVTIYDPTAMSQNAFTQAICPNGRIRGLRELFYQHNPFSDVVNPTKGEVDEWHRLLINHIRTLVGYPMPDYAVQKDYCLFARATWGDERKFTTQWDAAYPGVIDSAAGPCVGGTNSHCGASFMPSAVEQIPYLPQGHATCGTPPGSEGIFGAGANKPWAIKMSSAFCSNLSHEGFWGGHTGPWFHREKFGFSFWDSALRAKWSGALHSSLYSQP